MATRVRKQVYIEPDQELLLKRLAAELGVTEAEIIRQAIDRWTHDAPLLPPDTNAWSEERSFIESLMRRGKVAGGRAWTRDDLHDRNALR